MAGYYKVELEALARLSAQLGECGDTMRSAMKQLKDIGPEGSGYAELEEACDAFQNKWGYGIGLIADATSGVTEGLSETRKVYETLEEQIAEAFTVSGTADGK
ncbi:MULTISPECIES: hypothetical protein [Streptomyces]|uniref:Uncharacterized protein n=2 Tax=Streptomyces TaxID=1883 RepID=B5I6S0_STRX2|nr:MULTISPECIES: hypothetical protein [Streptomyces]EDY60775.1 conserved hypothetical protein [Streptomyces sviceus ATCC 29083]MYT08771.1 hypothetical protein [Streptomyces sp. SID5470]